MIKKKNGFLTFIFSCLPGAGEMYMGFFKQGLSIMTLFFLLILVSSWMKMGAFMYVIPVVWFYSFFRVNNLHSLPDEEFYALEDKFLFELEEDKLKSYLAGKQGRTILAVVLIVIGASAFWDMLMSLLRNIFIDLGYDVFVISRISDLSRNVPQMVASIAIIIFGVHLMKGKKVELQKNEEIQGKQDMVEQEADMEKTCISIEEGINHEESK